MSAVDMASLQLSDALDLTPWLEDVSTAPDALMLNDDGSQALVHGLAPLLLPSGDRHGFYGAVLTIDPSARAVSRALPIMGGREGSFDLIVYGGNLGAGLEGIAVFVRGSESGILYSTDLGSGANIFTRPFERPECGVLDSGRSSVIVYAGLRLITMPIRQVTGETYHKEAVKVLDVRAMRSGTVRSGVCRIAIDANQDIAYLLDPIWQRLVSIDLRSFSVMDIQVLDAQPSDIAVLPTYRQVAVTFPKLGQIRLYQAITR